jgi:RNA polymerase-binding transcription factor DksA
MLTRASLEIWRAKLLGLRQRLDDQLAHLRAESAHSTSGDEGGNDVNRTHHRDDVAKEKATEEVLVGMMGNEMFLRQEVEDALERIRLNRFGVCETCEKPIPKERLELLPYARRCVRCADLS